MQWDSTFLRLDGYRCIVHVVGVSTEIYISFEQVKKPGVREDNLGVEGAPPPWPQFCTDHVGLQPTEGT